jgi:VCBS repeat-containing protein
VWSDYTSQAEVELAQGIRYDVTYYYWPGTWVLNRPGFMGGSGMPMRFAKSTGDIIDVYQDVTEMIDEDSSSHTFPFFATALLDKAIGAEGYYGAFTANMHGDGGQNADVKQAQIVAAAQARSVPVVSASQMLDWLDGRNNSSFGSLSWGGLQLSFSVTRAPGANGLRGMLPAFSGGSLDSITRNGTPIGFTLTTIKGVVYAFFDATTGSYVATYLPDSTPPIISNVNATPLSEATAAVTWTTNEAATTRVDYGTSAGTLNQFANDNTLVGNHAITLNSLNPNTTYHYRVTSVDFFGNPSTFPAPPAAPLTFATPPLLQSFLDTTAADFTAGTPGTATHVAQTTDGEVMLKPTDGSEFFGPGLPAGWTSGVWDPSGSVTVNNGQLLLNNGWARTTGSYTPGRSLEFVANFGADAFQHSGFAQNFNCGEPWAIFSTAQATGELYARTTAAGCGADVNQFIPGNWNGTTHRFRIDWNTTDVAYFIDGVEVARHNVQITPQMQMLAASDFDEGGANPGLLSIDWERMSAYPASGEFLSRVFDAGSSVSWYNVLWNAGLPAGGAVAMHVRVGNTAIPDGSWSAFAAISGSGGLISGVPPARYIQYRATLSTTNSYFSPDVQSVTVNHAVGSPNTPPTAVDDVVTINEDTPHTFPATGTGSLVANDTDAETPTQLTVIAVSGATNGTAILNLDGSVTFTPTANVSGVGTFNYTVSDGALTDDGAVTVTINAVNDPPVGVADPSPTPGSFYNATEDTQLVIPVATGVLANDTDVDTPHGNLTAQIHSQPAHGAVTLNADGSFTYTPAPNYSGPDGFFYKASDGSALSDPTGVSILVQGVNDLPVANADTYDFSRSGVPVAVTSLTRSGTTATATTAIQHGFTTGHPVRISGATQAEYNGTFTVTATGGTTFTFEVTGTPASPATGSIVASADDTTRTVAAPGVLGNDTDVDGQPLSSVINTTTTNGTLTLNSNGSFTYTPNVAFVGVDTFTYMANDGIGNSNVATVTINVHNEIATQTAAAGDTVSTGVGATASDPIETSVTTPLAGVVSIVEGPISGANPAPGYSFLGQEVGITVSSITNENPLTDPNNPLLLTFTVDASLVAVGQTVNTLQVFRNGVQLANCPAPPLSAGNLPCVSNRTTLGDGDLQFTVKTLAPSQWDVGALIGGDTNASTLEDTVLNGDLKTISGHPNPSSLTYTTEVAPTNGNLVLNTNGTFAYTPAANFNGSDSFMYKATDTFGAVGYGTVSITITPVNDPPSFNKGANQSVQKNSGAHTVPGWATAISAGPSNESSQAVTFNVSSNNPSLFSAGPEVASNGTLTFTLATGQAGVATVTVAAVDDGGTANGGVNTSAGQDFTITVVDPPPVALCQNVTVAAPLVGYTFASINNGSNDPDGGPVTLAQVPPGPYVGGNTSVVLQVTDSANQTTTCSATVTVTPYAQGASFGFEEASGTTSVDSSGNANNGTFAASGGPTRVTAGRFGSAMQFDGVNDLISVVDANSLDFTSAMTLMAWVKPTTITGWRNVLMKQAGSDLVYGIYANDTTSGSGRPAGYTKSGGVTRSVRATEGALANRWMHVAVTFASATNQMRIYIDGELHRTITTSGVMTASTGPLTMGGNNVWLDEFFSGALDEVRVMNLALSEADIRTLMQSPVVPGSAPPATSTTGLVAAYSFDNGTATDATGLGHNGVLTGTTSAAGKFGNALSFNATSDLVTVADANDLDFITSMTLEAYVKPSTLSDWRTVMLKEGPEGLVYGLYSSDEVQHAAGFARIAGSDRDVRESQALPLNAWSHVVVTYDKTLGMMQLWVDGSKRDQRLVTGDIQASTGPLYFGGNAFWGEYFGGQIDNIRIYNRPLNVVEIQTNLGVAVQ